MRWAECGVRRAGDTRTSGTNAGASARPSRNRIARSVWSASSLLAPSLSVAVPKAGASSTHSKRYAREDVRTAPEYVTGLTFQSTMRLQAPAPAAGGWRTASVTLARRFVVFRSYSANALLPHLYRARMSCGVAGECRKSPPQRERHQTRDIVLSGFGVLPHAGGQDAEGTRTCPAPTDARSGCRVSRRPMGSH